MVKDELRRALSDLELSRHRLEEKIENPDDMECVRDFVEKTLGLHTLSLKNPGHPLFGIGLARSSESAKRLISGFGMYLHTNGFLTKVYNIYPYPYLLSSLIKQGFGGRSEIGKEAATAAISLGGHPFDYRLSDWKIHHVSADLLLKMAKNTLDNFDIMEFDDGMPERHKYTVCKDTILGLINHTDNRGDTDKVIDFISDNKLSLLGISKQLASNERGVIDSFVIENDRSNISKIIKEKMPDVYEHLVESGAMREHILNNLMTDGYDILETPYTDLIGYEDILHTAFVILRLGGRSLRSDYQKLSAAFEAYGKGDLYSRIQNIDPIPRVRGAATEMLKKLDEIGPFDLDSHISLDHVSVINNLLLVDTIAGNGKERLIKSDDLMDKWAAFVMLNTNQFMDDSIPIGPYQCQMVVKKLTDGNISPQRIPDNVLKAGIFRDTLRNLPEKESINLLNKHGEWEYLRTINFKHKGTKRHKLGMDLGI